MSFKIVENSLFARLARLVLKSPNVAMVLGNTIHLSGVKRDVFLRNEEWVAHELCHIRQFRENGYLRFLWLYLLESKRKGYYNNKYEVEARLAAKQYLAAHKTTAAPVIPTSLPLPADTRPGEGAQENAQV